MNKIKTKGGGKNKNIVTRKYIPRDISVYIRYLYQDKGVRGAELLNRFPEYSKASIYRHVNKPLNCTDVHDQRKNNKGRPCKLTLRDERNLIRQLLICRKTTGSFTASKLRTEAGILPTVSLWTIRRVLHKHKYFYLQARKKGLLTPKDKRRRLKFARKMKKLAAENFWRKQISFYFDGTSFVHKTNPFNQARSPKTRVWRQCGEGLDINCTSKGKKAGVEGRVAHFFVSIAYDKGVIACDQYKERLNGKFFAKYVGDRFPTIFSLSANPKTGRFLQDGDPSQNSAAARSAFEDVGALLFKIPPRSPDINPIENVFHLVSKKLEKQALRKQITYETFEDFSERVRKTMEKFSIFTINNIIESMNKRINKIIKKRGGRLKY